MLVCQGDLKNLDLLCDRVINASVDKFQLFASLLFVLEGKELVLLEEATCFDRLYDPVARKDVAVEIRSLFNFGCHWRNLVGEALVHVAHETTMLLNEQLHVVSLVTRRQVEHHGRLPNHRDVFNEDGLCAHFNLFQLI